MNSSKRIRISQLSMALAVALTAPVMAQNTSSAIGGRITSNDGKPVAGATVSIKHNQSGSVSSAVTDAEGRYSSRGLRVGGADAPADAVCRKPQKKKRREHGEIAA